MPKLTLDLLDRNHYNRFPDVFWATAHQNRGEITKTNSLKTFFRIFS